MLDRFVVVVVVVVVVVEFCCNIFVWSVDDSSVPDSFIICFCLVILNE